jgi:hypothetical protein
MTDAAKEVLNRVLKLGSPTNFVLKSLTFMKDNLASIELLSEFSSHLTIDSNYDEISKLAGEVCEIILNHPLHSGSIQIKSLCKIVRRNFVHLHEFHFLNTFFLSLQLNQHKILHKLLDTLFQLRTLSFENIKQFLMINLMLENILNYFF